MARVLPEDRDRRKLVSGAKIVHLTRAYAYSMIARMHSKLRIQDHNGRDLVRISLMTGEVELISSSEVAEAALIFWGAVATIFKVIDTGGPIGDLILRAGRVGEWQVTKPGDITLTPGAPGRVGNGGNVIVTIGPELDGKADVA